MLDNPNRHVNTHYRTIKPLADYIDRVEAEELNFRRFMVKEYRGNYYVEKVLIRIKEDGSISCSSKEYAPTKEEADAIKIALASAGWPKSITATMAQRDDVPLSQGSESWNFIDRSGDIIMVQERKEIKGRRFFIPWTYWSDGKWRNMEPDGKLPFWKPAPNIRVAQIMIHEGAKAAQAAQRIVDKKESDHPWYAELCNYDHWGMIGGALAAHRSDYAEINAQKPLGVVYFCDNDSPGKSALTEVSKAYGRSLKGVMLDQQWPTSWDMADPMPTYLFKGKRYVGPSLKEIMIAATWATEPAPATGQKGRPTLRVTAAFRDEWLHCTSPEVYIHKDKPDVIRTREEFNGHVKPWSDADDTARLLKSDAASKSSELKYHPGLKPGVYSSRNGRYINTHVPTNIKSEDGDPAPWLEFMEHLLPEERDRKEMMRWLATLIASPEIKMAYGVLLISEAQGVGKGTLGEKILAPLVGLDNTSYPSEKNIVEGQFNYWMAHKRLAVVHEIYAGQNSKAYNNLKSTITDKYITVNKKHQATYDIDNYIHIFACSNSPRAIRMSWDDRRWFVPVITDHRRTPAYWTQLNTWLTDEGGLGIIKKWAETYPDRVIAGAPAPMSTHKIRIITEGYNPGMALVDDVLDRIEGAVKGEDKDTAERLGIKNGHAALVDVALVDLIRDKIHAGRPSRDLERPATLRKIARSRGWEIGKTRVRTKAMGRKENDLGIVLAFFASTQGPKFDEKGHGLDFIDVRDFLTF